MSKLLETNPKLRPVPMSRTRGRPALSAETTPNFSSFRKIVEPRQRQLILRVRSWLLLSFEARTTDFCLSQQVVLHLLCASVDKPARNNHPIYIVQRPMMN